jgi:hypothetical protein
MKRGKRERDAKRGKKGKRRAGERVNSIGSGADHVVRSNRVRPSSSE